MADATLVTTGALLAACAQSAELTLVEFACNIFERLVAVRAHKHRDYRAGQDKGLAVQ